MLAISRPAAIRNMVDMGLSYDNAVLLLDELKPAARMDGHPYYSPAHIALAASKGAKK